MKILISPGYGAGWSTWAYGDADLQHEALTSPSIINAIERHGGDSPEFDSAVDAFAAEHSDFYLGGARDLIVVDIPAGTRFRIHEYDGFESIDYADDDTWTTAT